MNKIFKLFSVLAVLMLVMGLSSCIGIFTDGGGSFNGDIYNVSDFESFVSSSTTAGALKADITSSSYLLVSAGKTKTLDLNGYTITVTGNTALAVQGTISISDSSSNKTGKIISTGEGDADHSPIAVSVLSGGNVTISGGTYAAKDFALYVSDGGTATITSGKFGYSAVSNDNPLIGIGVNRNGTSVGTIVNMNCKVYAKQTAVKNAGTITEISGGEYTTVGSSDSVFALYNSGTIGSIHSEDGEGGAFYATNDKGTGTYYAFALYNTGTISSNGGYFEAAPDGHSYNYSASGATNNLASGYTAAEVYSPDLTNTDPRPTN